MQRLEKPLSRNDFGRLSTMNKEFAVRAGLGAAALGLAGAVVTPTAHAGNIALTGHDDDLHCDGGFGDAFHGAGVGPCTQLKSLATFVTAGSALPILVIDNGSELTSALTFDGFTVHAVTVASVTSGMFDNSMYSAFGVASVTSCGGCAHPIG